jgi:hypothetical protein
MEEIDPTIIDVQIFLGLLGSGLVQKEEVSPVIEVPYIAILWELRSFGER